MEQESGGNGRRRFQKIDGEISFGRVRSFTLSFNTVMPLGDSFQSKVMFLCVLFAALPNLLPACTKLMYHHIMAPFCLSFL